MKKLLFLAVMALILASSCNHPEQEQQTMNEENDELTAFDVQEAFESDRNQRLTARYICASCEWRDSEVCETIDRLR